MNPDSVHKTHGPEHGIGFDVEPWAGALAVEGLVAEYGLSSVGELSASEHGAAFYPEVKVGGNADFDRSEYGIEFEAGVFVEYQAAHIYFLTAEYGAIFSADIGIGNAVLACGEHVGIIASGFPGRSENFP